MKKKEKIKVYCQNCKYLMTHKKNKDYSLCEHSDNFIMCYSHEWLNQEKERRYHELAYMLNGKNNCKWYEQK